MMGNPQLQHGNQKLLLQYGQIFGKASLGCVVDLVLFSVQEVGTHRNYLLHGELSSSAEYMPNRIQYNTTFFI